MSSPRERAFDRLLVRLQRLHDDIPALFPQDNERVADLQDVVESVTYIARAARERHDGFTADTPHSLKKDLEEAIQVIHQEHSRRQNSTQAAPTSTAQNTVVSTSTSPTTSQHSTDHTTALDNTAPGSQHNNTSAPPTVTNIQASASRASNSKSSVQNPTHRSFNPENMTDADREAAATLISLSESDHNTNSSFNSSRSSSFADPSPAHRILGAPMPAASYSSPLVSGAIASTSSHRLIAEPRARNVTPSNPSHSFPMYTSNGTSRKRSRDSDVDMYNNNTGASHTAIYSSSPPAPKRRILFPVIDERMSVHQGFAMGIDFVLQYLPVSAPGDYAATEELRSRIMADLHDFDDSAPAEHDTSGVIDGSEMSANTGANSVPAEHGTNGVVNGSEMPTTTGAKGFWDVI